MRPKYKIGMLLKFKLEEAAENYSHEEITGVVTREKDFSYLVGGHGLMISEEQVATAYAPIRERVKRTVTKKPRKVKAAKPDAELPL